MVRTDTVCTCDICGKQMFASETGHTHYQAYLVLGSNTNPDYQTKYEDVCDECTIAIQNTIAKRQGMSPVNMYFTDKLREICK